MAGDRLVRRPVTIFVENPKFPNIKQVHPYNEDGLIILPRSRFVTMPSNILDVSGQVSFREPTGELIRVKSVHGGLVR